MKHQIYVHDILLLIAYEKERKTEKLLILCCNDFKNLFILCSMDLVSPHAGPHSCGGKGMFD